MLPTDPSPNAGSQVSLKRQLLERLLRERAGGAPCAGPADSHRAAPLSSAQARIWFFEELRPGTSMFNVPFLLRLSGTLDVPAFERAVRGLLDRHDVFRTVIAAGDDGPLQVVALQPAPASLPFSDVSGLPADERSAEAERLISRTLREPFDLTRGPLYRAYLIRVSTGEHVFLLPMHHLICDGWSVQVIAQELGARYAGEATNTAPALAPVRVTYADFARRQQQRLAAGMYRSDLDYWKDRLSGAPATTELPTDFPRAAEQIAAGASESRVIGGELRDRLRGMAREHEVTLFMAMLATFNCLLLRLTGQDDLVVGVPVAGRTDETEPLVGCFINHVALRSDLSGDPPFSEVLQRVRHSALGAYAHQEVPFDRVVEEVQPNREPGRRPFFQIQFNMTFAACERLELPGVIATPGGVEDDWSRYDLSVFFIEFEDGIAWRVVYNSELYACATVQALMDRFEHLLAQVAADPSRRVSEYSLATAMEQDVLLDAFSAVLE